MEAIFPSSALAKSLPKVKSAAKDGLVRITEHGYGAYVFMTESQFDNCLQKAREEAVYEMELTHVIERGREDCAQGRYVAGTEEARKEIAKRRHASI